MTFPSESVNSVSAADLGVNPYQVQKKRVRTKSAAMVTVTFIAHLELFRFRCVSVCDTDQDAL